jgi:tetratricopeptide (TPR) repeat protein
MVEHDRIRRQQVLREVEGYLELLQVGQGRFSLPPEQRDRLAQCALDRLRDVRFFGRTQAAALLLEGQALRLMERYREAIEPLTRSSQLDRNNIHVWLALGWCYKRLGRLDLAIQSLEEALRVRSEEAIIHYNLACYWSLAGNRKLAVRYLSQALDLDPSYRELVGEEPDFDPIRNDPEFQLLVGVEV